MILLSRCSFVLKVSCDTKGTLGIPCGTKKSFFLSIPYSFFKISMAFFAITITAELFSQMEFTILFLARSGSGRTEWKVVTTGFSISSKNGIKWLPNSPPNIPNSCWMQISFMSFD